MRRFWCRNEQGDSVTIHIRLRCEADINDVDDLHLKTGVLIMTEVARMTNCTKRAWVSRKWTEHVTYLPGNIKWATWFPTMKIEAPYTTRIRVTSNAPQCRTINEPGACLRAYCFEMMLQVEVRVESPVFGSVQKFVQTMKRITRWNMPVKTKEDGAMDDNVFMKSFYFVIFIFIVLITRIGAIRWLHIRSSSEVLGP